MCLGKAGFAQIVADYCGGANQYVSNINESTLRALQGQFGLHLDHLLNSS